jgi:hypothetical protein
MAERVTIPTQAVYIIQQPLTPHHTIRLVLRTVCRRCKAPFAGMTPEDKICHIAACEESHG